MRVYTTDYRFVEFPKWVRLPDGKSVLVSSADEEAALLGAFDKPKRRKRDETETP